MAEGVVPVSGVGRKSAARGYLRAVGAILWKGHRGRAAQPRDAGQHAGIRSAGDSNLQFRVGT